MCTFSVISLQSQSKYDSKVGKIKKKNPSPQKFKKLRKTSRNGTWGYLLVHYEGKPVIQVSKIAGIHVFKKHEKKKSELTVN